MNPNVNTTFASPDPSASPLNLIQLVALLNTLVSSEIIGSYLPYIIGSTTPGVDDQDKAWLELDTGGRPKSIKIFYHGSWRRVYNGMIGEIRGFNGAPGYSTAGPFDVTGLGIVGGDLDGWHICNGQDGTPDLSDRFVCGADMNQSGVAGGYDPVKGWVTYIPGQTPALLTHGGGLWTTELKPENIPQAAVDAQVPVDHYSADAAARDPTAQLYGKPDASADAYLIPAIPAAPAKAQIFTAPPFYTLAWMIFVGYSS